MADAAPDHLTLHVERLQSLVDATPGAVRLATRNGEIDAAYDCWPRWSTSSTTEGIAP